MNKLYKKSLQYAKKVFFQNNDDMGIFVQLGNVDRAKCQIVNGAGVDLCLFPYTPICGRKICLFVGRLLADKGLREFVQSARKVKTEYPDARFVIVGGYDENPMAIGEEEVNAWVEEGVVEYWGERKDMREVYGQCDIFVLPSYHEGMPRTTLEAMATGRPVVTTDAPGCRDTVVDGVNGYLVPVRDVDSLSERIKYLLRFPDRAKEMGNCSREMAEEKFDQEKINQFLVQEICEEQKNG